MSIKLNIALPLNAHPDRAEAHKAAAAKILEAYKLLAEAELIMAGEEPALPSTGVNGEAYTHRARCFGYDINKVLSVAKRAINSVFCEIDENGDHI